MSEQTIWEQIAAPLDPSEIKVRKDKDRDISYIDARTVIERLNAVVPGRWTFETELLHVPSGEKGDKWIFKGRLTIDGVWQEDVGMNDNEMYFEPAKSAVSDCLKRCAVHFGIGLELYPGHANKNGNGDGYSKPKPAQKPQNAPSAPKQAAHVSTIEEAAAPRPLTPTALREWFDTLYIAAPRAEHDATLDTDGAKALAIEFKRLGLADDERHAFAANMFGVNSFKALSVANAKALALWLKDIPSARREAQDFLASLQPEPEGKAA